MKVPAHWSNDDVLDHLFDALQGFPDVRKIVRCTRCVQMQFAFMHMDVTILDRMREPRPERVAKSSTAPMRATATASPRPVRLRGLVSQERRVPSRDFLDEIRERRRTFGVDRLPDLPLLAKSQQERLPPVIPERIDTRDGRPTS